MSFRVSFPLEAAYCIYSVKFTLYRPNSSTRPLELQIKKKKHWEYLHYMENSRCLDLFWGKDDSSGGKVHILLSLLRYRHSLLQLSR